MKLAKCVYIWLSISVAFMLFGSWGLDPFFTWTFGAEWSNEITLQDKFWSMFDFTRHVGVLAAIKAAHYGRPKRMQIIIDFVLIYFWADLLDRIMGLSQFMYRDFLILPLYVLGVILVSIKHKYLYRHV